MKCLHQTSSTVSHGGVHRCCWLLRAALCMHQMLCVRRPSKLRVVSGCACWSVAAVSDDGVCVHRRIVCGHQTTKRLSQWCEHARASMPAQVHTCTYHGRSLAYARREMLLDQAGRERSEKNDQTRKIRSSGEMLGRDGLVRVLEMPKQLQSNQLRLPLVCWWYIFLLDIDWSCDMYENPVSSLCSSRYVQGKARHCVLPL